MRPPRLCVLAMALTAAMLAESDPRFGGFDFRAAHEEAPADLQALLDQHESLPFRRRGYVSGSSAPPRKLSLVDDSLVDAWNAWIPTTRSAMRCSRA